MTLHYGLGLLFGVELDTMRSGEVLVTGKHKYTVTTTLWRCKNKSAMIESLRCYTRIDLATAVLVSALFL